MNRKLIRPNLADVKSQDRDSREKRDSYGGEDPLRRRAASSVPGSTTARIKVAETDDPLSAASPKNRRPPQVETNAEIFYYKKQIDLHTLMIIVLQDGEEITGTIEWYDRNALKINRKEAPNILLLKHNIKYMFKAEDRG